MVHDTVIVGAGIAGLWLAEQIATRGHRVLVLEKYDYFGGRVLTSAKHGVEVGAGRVHERHWRVGTLLKRFSLDTVPLSTKVDWRSIGSDTAEPASLEETWAPIIAQIVRLSPRTLATHTLRELADRILGRRAAKALLDRYPYRAEVEKMRADLGIASFHAEMGTRAGYFGVRGGLTQLTDALVAACRAAGVRFRTGAAVTRVDPSVDGYEIHLADGENPVKTRRVILATHVAALTKMELPAEVRAGDLARLGMAPLTRVYATYPIHKEAAWFADLPKTVTDSPLRYIIPINPAKGMIMISYVDDRDTAAWKGLKGPALVTAIQSELRRLFPERSIPEPTWMHAYEWTDGCTYWRPGLYNPREVAVRLMHPAAGLWIAGESLSVGQQAWMEGALAVAEDVLGSYLLA
jgi:monoamine oxidase